MRKQHWLLAFLLIALVLFTSACGNAGGVSPSSSSPQDPASFTLLYQPGASVAMIWLKHQKTLEQQFPHTTIEWKIVNSGSAVREAMIANQGQLGILGVPPYLVGWDRGYDWKILLATSRGDGWLVAKDPRLKTLKDFTPNDKIGVVAPDSQQAILLRKAALEQLGNAHALDKNMLTISSTDGEQALLSGQLAAQFAGSPFQEREVAAGAHIVLHSKDIFGPVGAGLIAIAPNFYEQYPNFIKTVRQDLLNATAAAQANLDQAALYLAQDQGSGGGSQAQFKIIISNPSIVYDTTPSGLIAYATFMQSIGLISKVPGSVKDLEVPLLNGIGN